MLNLFEVSNRDIINNFSTLNYSMELVSYNLLFVFLRGFCTMKGIEILDKFLEEDPEMKKFREKLLK